MGNKSNKPTLHKKDKAGASEPKDDPKLKGGNADAAEDQSEEVEQEESEEETSEQEVEEGAEEEGDAEEAEEKAPNAKEKPSKPPLKPNPAMSVAAKRAADSALGKVKEGESDGKKVAKLVTHKRFGLHMADGTLRFFKKGSTHLTAAEAEFLENDSYVEDQGAEVVYGTPRR